MLTGLFGSNLNNIEKLLTSSHSTVDNVLARPDLISYLRMQREHRDGVASLLAFVDRHFFRLIVMALQQDPSTEKTSLASRRKGRKQRCLKQPLGLMMKNAAELIAFHLVLSQGSIAAFERTVHETFAVFEYEGTLSSLAVDSFQCILLAAVNVNFSATICAISAALNDKIIRGVVRNVSSSFAIADIILKLFVPSADVVKTGSQDISMLVLSTAWVQSHFEKELVSHLTFALRKNDQQPYFHFLKGLLNSGFSQGAGPLVDVLLSYDVISHFMKNLVEACEEAKRSPCSVPLAAEGVQVLHSMLALVRQSLLPLDTNDMAYTANVFLIAPIKCLKMYAERLCGLISPETSAGFSPRVPDLQVALCELFVEILRFRQRDLDQIIVNSLFLERLLTISVKYSECNRLSLLLHQTLRLFSACASSADNVLLQHALAVEKLPKRGFLSECVDVCTNESLRYTPLSALMIDIFLTLSDNVLFREPFGSMRHVTEPFLSNPALKKRIQQMNIPITGAGFSAVGTAGRVAARHRPFINYTGRELACGKSFSMSPVSIAIPPSFKPEVSFGEGGKGEACVVSTTEWGTNTPVDISLPDTVFSTTEELFCDGEDTVTIELEWADNAPVRETSPQVRAYPRFRDMQISFEGRANDPT